MCTVSAEPAVPVERADPLLCQQQEIGSIREIERVCHTTITEKKLPGAAKVLKAKADKYLNKAWELHEHEDIELMKSFYSGKWKRKAVMHWSWQPPC